MTASHGVPGWRGAFLRALARGGSVAGAARACGIDRTSAYQLRRRNAAFAASWARALERARERLGVSFETPLRDGGCAASSAAPQDERGARHSRVARGRAARGREARGRGPKLREDEVVRGSKAGRPCIARVGPGRWSAASEQAFLAELTATANVSAAARAAGVSTTAAYNRRRLRPGFAEAWRAALGEGYARIETHMIHHASVALDPEPWPEPGPEAWPEAARAEPGVTFDQALNLFRLHRASVQGGAPQRYGWRRREADIEAVRAEVLRKVAVLARARERDREVEPERERP